MWLAARTVTFKRLLFLSQPEFGYLIWKAHRLIELTQAQFAAVRSPKQAGQIPAVALTAYAGEYDQRQGLAVGFQLQISKPVEPEELVKAIANLIVRGSPTYSG
jgi:CheY-like chemotaxis protein